LDAVCARALDRVGQRAAVRAAWAIGQPYVGETVSTVRVRADRPLGSDLAALPSVHGSRSAGRLPLGLAGLGAAAGGVGLDLAAGLPAGLGAAAGIAALGTGVPLLWRAGRLRAAPDALGQLTRAVADGLHEAGGTSAGAAAVVVTPGPDGWLRCHLGGVSEAESALFTTSLDELLAPLTDPKHLVGRMVLHVPRTARSRFALAARSVVGRPIEAAITWHAVPSWSAAGARRLRICLAAWERYVGPARHLTADSPEGQAVLDLFRGADPFAITTQLRTIWRVNSATAVT
jgi:hypothetical protein